MSKSELKVVSLGDIQISETNPRKTFDEQSLKELTESIKQHGVLQPILIRPIPDTVGGKNQQIYLLVCGERRYRAAVSAKLKEIPANIRELNDDEAFELQIIENLERKDVHPIEEAEAFKRMLDSERYTIEDIAAKIVKSETYVLQRLKFVELIDELKKDFYDGKFGIGHAVLLARLDPETQMQQFKDCNGEGGWHQGYGTVQELKESIEDDLYNLDDAPFDINDETFPGASACSVCPKHAGANPSLFPDVEDKDKCFDRTCYSNKTSLFVERRVAKAITEAEPIHFGLGYRDKPSDFIKQLCDQNGIVILNGDDWTRIWRSEEEKDIKMMYVGGDDAGKIIPIRLLKSATDKGVSSDEPSIEYQIKKIEERASRALELDNVKVFNALKELPDIYDEYPNNDSPLSDLEVKAMWYLFCNEVPDYSSTREYKKMVNMPDSYNSLHDFEFFKTVTMEDLKLETLVRMAIKDKLSKQQEPNFGKCTKSKFFIEIINEKMPDQVKALMEQQQKEAQKRIERSNAKIEALREQLNISKPQESKWPKVSKRYSLNNSYFKNRHQNAPDSIIEIKEYLEEHGELPFDYDHTSGDWLYDAIIEKQKRSGVYHSQYFTPPSTAKRIAEIAEEYFGDDLGPDVMDACCGFGMLSKEMREKGYIVRGFDFSADMVDLYHHYVDGLAEQQNYEDDDDFDAYNMVVCNPPYEVPKLTRLLQLLRDSLLADNGRAVLLLPKGFIDKDRPKTIPLAMEKFKVLHREDMTEDFVHTKIKAEIVVIQKVM